MMDMNAFAAQVCGFKPQPAYQSQTQAFIASLKLCPSADDLKALCTHLHSLMVDADAPELVWLDFNFEDMADQMVQAISSAKEDDRPNLEATLDRQDYLGRRAA